MSRYETRVKVWFYSEGASPSVIVKKLLALGFKPLRGAYDLVQRFYWKVYLKRSLQIRIPPCVPERGQPKG